MRQFRTYGSVRGVLGNRHPYRDPLALAFSKNLQGLILLACEPISYSLQVGYCLN